MPIIDLNGKRIKDEDIGFLMKMLKGSLENHIFHLTEWQSKAENREEDPAFYDRILQHFRNGLEQLPEKINAAKEGNRKIKVQDLISEVYSGISEKVVDQLHKEDMNQLQIFKTVNSFLMYEASDWADRNMAAEYPNKQEMKLNAKDTDAAYERTENGFMFATEPFDGIEDIEDYDPARDSVAALYSGRSGNSGTLKHTVDEFQKKLEGMREDAPTYDATKMRLQMAEEARAGLIMGGETARSRSVELRNKTEVTFGDLYETLSRLNEVVMPTNKQGGKLRGFSLGSKELTGSGTFIAPITVYKTLSKIADGINQIKKVEDPALRKTRAIQLAAFSYQMLISEHVFPDANGRTSRLFADTILQTFGLPPHIPDKGIFKYVTTMGKTMDFNAGAAIFLEGIRKSNTILREDRNNAPETEEEKLNTRQGLLSKIRETIARESGQIAGSKAYEDYILAMEELDGRMEELSQLDAKGNEHILTVQEKEDLLTKMVRVAETGEHFLDTGKAAGKDLSKGVFDMVSLLQTMLSKDYDTINAYDPENPRSLKELQEDSRTVTIDLRNRNIKTLGHLTSTRIPMTIYGANGKRRTGVFTKAVTTDVMTRYDALVSKAAKGCSQAAVDELMGIIPKIRAKFMDMGTKKYDDSPMTVNDPPEQALGMFLIFCGSYRKKKNGRKIRDEELRNMLRESKVKEELIPDKAIKILCEGLNDMSGNAANKLLTLGLQLPNGTRLDHRNSAMSIVAGLLGAGSLLARSDSVRCIDKDGNVTSGTFMDFGKGLDLEGDKSLARHLAAKPFDRKKHRNTVIRQLAELQIIDYLCMNIDRHYGNILYQVDAAGYVTGIQGIDHDSSFGRRKCSESEKQSLTVISQSMAKKIRNISPEMLRFALRGSGLNDEEVSSAVDRLKDLKTMISSNIIKTIADNGFIAVKSDTLFPADPKCPNIIRKTIGYISKTAENRVSKNIPFESYVEKPVELSKVSSTDRKYTVGGMVDLSERANRMLTDKETNFDVSKINTFGRRSNEFTELLDAVRNVSNIPGFLKQSNQLDEEKFISDLNEGEALMVFDEAFHNLKDKVNTYLRKKTGERGLDETGKIKGKNDYEKKRIEYAKNVLSLVREYTAIRKGPVNKADKLEEQTLKNRRDRNAVNKGPKK